MQRQTAEATALNVLGWLVSEDDLLAVFMGATGASAEVIRNQATDREFLGSVLDFLLMDDAWVIRACDALQLPYEQIVQARQYLPGGAQINWT